MSITATAPLFKSLTMAESCLLSSPSTLFHTFSLPSKSINLHLSLKTNRSISPAPLFVAQEAGFSLDLVPSADAGGDDSDEGEAYFVQPLEDAKLFVGNLNFDVDSTKLAMLFEQAGTVEIAEVIYNRETDRSRGFGFVTMSTVEEAESAIEKFNRYDYDGRLLVVNKASPKGSRSERTERAPRTFESGFRIYVAGFPWEVDDSRLEQVFSEHGKVVSARVVYDRDTGRSRGFGFVTMSDETERNGAIAALDGQILEGRTLRVSVAEDRPRRGSF